MASQAHFVLLAVGFGCSGPKRERERESDVSTQYLDRVVIHLSQHLPYHIASIFSPKTVHVIYGSFFPSRYM